jgi:alpha-galactosidase
MPKIVIVGAGSYIFSAQLIYDFLYCSEMSELTISLMDIDEDRLKLIVKLAQKMAADRESGARIEYSSNRQACLDGADYVIMTAEIGGLEQYLHDIEIPDKYGINQNVGDTIGPGGVFRALRTLPFLLDVCRDMERLCPKAYLLNYTNPMAINCWGISEASSIRVIGLCHSVQGTARQLATYMQIPFEELTYWVAGINHMAWFLTLNWKGTDAYPILKSLKVDDSLWTRVTGGYERFGMKDLVRFEIMKHFGYFVTESPYHMSEYVPYFRKSEKQVTALSVANRWWLDHKRSSNQYIEKLEGYIKQGKEFIVERSDEYASYIVQALETGQECVVNGNVKNEGLISNLPDGCCVEVPCLVNRSGVHPCRVGALPAQCAALNRTNINVQELAVRAALTGDVTATIQAVALDPLTSSLLALEQIEWMVQEMLIAEKTYLPQFHL